jgi:hypothetical protein
MSRRVFLLAATLWIAGAPLHAAQGPPPAHLRSVTLHIFSRVFASFHDRVQALPNKEFRVGDTEYSARVVQFVPDFTLNLKIRQVASRSGEPKNPAFRIVVSKGGTPQDTLWAFFNMPPHFGSHEVLAFVATRIEFTNRPPLASRDSIALRIEGNGGAGH